MDSIRLDNVVTLMLLCLLRLKVAIHLTQDSKCLNRYLDAKDHRPGVYLSCDVGSYSRHVECHHTEHPRISCLILSDLRVCQHLEDHTPGYVSNARWRLDEALRGSRPSGSVFHR